METDRLEARSIHQRHVGRMLCMPEWYQSVVLIFSPFTKRCLPLPTLMSLTKGIVVMTERSSTRFETPGKPLAGVCVGSPNVLTHMSSSLSKTVLPMG